MKRLLFLVLILSVVACKKSPTKVYLSMEKAAQKGNVKEFLGYFDSKSQPFVAAVLQMQKTYEPGGAKPSKLLQMLTMCDVEQEAKTEAGNAYLVLDCPQGERYLGFVKEKGRWRVNIDLTERLQKRLGHDRRK